MKLLGLLLTVCTAGTATAKHCTGSCQQGDALAIMPTVMQLKFAQRAELSAAGAVTASSTSGERVNCTGGFAGEYACNNVDLLAYLPLTELGSAEGADGNDMWGWTDPLTLREYVITGQMDGTSFVDISDPINPLVLAFVPSHLESFENQFWRDIKVYNNYAFIVGDNGEHGMQVFDLTRLRGLHEDYSAISVFQPETHYDEFGDCHNIIINEDTGYAYCVGSFTCRGGLHIVDISTPLEPEFVGCASGDGYIHDAQCVIYHGADERYVGREICFAYNEDSLTIYDMTDKERPAIVSRSEYVNASYTHQGWLTEDHTHLLLNDELDEYYSVNSGFTETYIWNVEDLMEPTLLSIYTSPVTSIDHNIYIKGDYSYQSNYASGLRVNDISNIANGELSEAGFFDVRPEGDEIAFLGTWSNYPFFDSGVVAIQSIERGLFLVKPTVPGVGPLQPAEDRTPPPPPPQQPWNQRRGWRSRRGRN